MKRIGQRRGGPPPAAPRDLVVVLRPDTPASPPLLAAARGNGGTVAVVLPLKIHGYAFGLPNPGLLPTAKERAAAEAAITTTVRRFERAGIDVDGQIVVTRHAARAIARIVRRRGATRVLLEPPTGGRLRRLSGHRGHRSRGTRIAHPVIAVVAVRA
jgi:hypothetical protein